MRLEQPQHATRWITAGLAALLAAALSGWAFAMWIEHGGGIFLAMAQSGLSWCF
ncbi:hypothetical protein [Nitratireductor sp. ZSWI3]|uniref:hypothetical protein n=1 Tax=Nitratireductor sp. ZSWI3 TaxID=2966359 RepID=UPI00214FD91E|nr:hypothetical protein [Nitratireductor sp. ZSWI3]MCR4269102.1 hypothetical protein [Nitratireductor sp. ZSWI3]